MKKLLMLLTLLPSFMLAQDVQIKPSGDGKLKDVFVNKTKLFSIEVFKQNGPNSGLESIHKIYDSNGILRIVTSERNGRMIFVNDSLCFIPLKSYIPSSKLFTQEDKKIAKFLANEVIFQADGFHEEEKINFIKKHNGDCLNTPSPIVMNPKDVITADDKTIYFSGEKIGEYKFNMKKGMDIYYVFNLNNKHVASLYYYPSDKNGLQKIAVETVGETNKFSEEYNAFDYAKDKSYYAYGLLYNNGYLFRKGQTPIESILDTYSVSGKSSKSGKANNAKVDTKTNADKKESNSAGTSKNKESGNMESSNGTVQTEYLAKTNEELVTLKQEATVKKDFDTAAKIKKEQDIRKEEQATISTLKAEMNAKAKAEDFEGAAEVKKKLDAFQSKVDKKDKLRKEIQIAVKAQDYDKAAKLKKELMSFY